jgi:predicted AAA+ superfamily ATPase
MQFERDLLGRLEGAARHFPVILLTGARQTGKTTLLRRTFSSHHYTSLDLPSDAALAEGSPATFFAEHPTPVLIDEVQYAPGLFRHIKAQVDERRHEFGRFVLTGSQKFPLMKEVSDSLAGRCAWFELEGLSANELARGGLDVASPASLSELLLRGQLPALWRDPQLGRADFWRSYLATYVERDVRQILNVGSLREFERFIRLAASYNGQLVNKADLARGIGVTAKTIDQWLSVLQASNQVELLEPYFANIGKRIVKSPKLYFCDTGLLCFLLGVDAGTMGTSPWLGAIWEAFVYAELRKFKAAHAPEQSIWFYRDQQGREVDFLVQGGAGLTAIECKWTELPGLDDARALGDVAALLAQAKPTPLPVRRVIAARPASSYPLADGTTVVHGSAIAAALGHEKRARAREK